MGNSPASGADAKQQAKQSKRQESKHPDQSGILPPSRTVSNPDTAKTFEGLSHPMRPRPSKPESQDSSVESTTSPKKLKNDLEKDLKEDIESDLKESNGELNKVTKVVAESSGFDLSKL